MADKKLDTQLVNAGRSKKYTLGAVNSVIQRASSLVFESMEAKKHATRNRADGAVAYTHLTRPTKREEKNTE
ncbi:PLP-dependent transferase, partial [Escherichia coli]|nr:PLP-dependent transferase [Escherichia coli]